MESGGHEIVGRAENAGQALNLFKTLQPELVRDPGESLETFPEGVWEEYDCENQKRPFFIVEKNELMPEKVVPGGDFGHRLVYVMCPKHPTEVVQGTLSTRIRFK